MKRGNPMKGMSGTGAERERARRRPSPEGGIDLMKSQQALGLWRKAITREMTGVVPVEERNADWQDHLPHGSAAARDAAASPLPQLLPSSQQDP